MLAMKDAHDSIKAPLIGGHVAIDFFNTSFTPEEEAIETIGDARSFLNWLIATGLIDEASAARMLKRFGPKALENAAAEARTFRTWARDWLLRWRVKPRAAYSEELAHLNKLLARGISTHEVKSTEEGFALLERPSLDSPDALVTLIALQVASLITQEDPKLIKSCAGDKCSLWFVDRTKAHRRIFCSASACGNRAKVAAFRQRQKGE
jgi:predicted RNA-binding Zn ribbon-like protein